MVDKKTQTMMDDEVMDEEAITSITSTSTRTNEDVVDVEARAATNRDHPGNESSPDPPTTTTTTTPMTVPAHLTKLKVNAMGGAWDRPPVDHFEDMSLREFDHYCHLHLSILRESHLGPTSMKHPSWEGSDDPPRSWIPLTVMAVVSLLVAVAVGLTIGLLTADDSNDDANGVSWGVGSGVIVVGVSFLVFLVCLVTYMACYGNSLHEPPMPNWIEHGGYVRNIRANVVCRYIMTCCYNGKVSLVDCIMNGEADKAFKKIQQTNNGQGPPPGGVCWLGDSEFTFWHHLSRDMKDFHDNHINAGFGGSRIVDIQRNIHRLCLDWDPSTVIVHASGNDYDFGPDITAGEIPAELLELFETIAAHPSVERIGYMLSSRRPVYNDAKWDFMVRVHSLTIEAIAKSPTLHNRVKVLDLRANVWPLDHFVAVDRVHLNDMGHFQKSKVLLPKMLAVWPTRGNPRS